MPKVALLFCLPFLATAFFTAAASGDRFSTEDTPGGVRILVGDHLFAEYRTNSGGQPAVWPLVGPSNIPLTRSYPIGPKRDDEPTDHPHHRSLWFAHGDVNGHDFWHDCTSETTHFIRHQAFEKKRAEQSQATLTTRNDWLAHEQKILEDRRTLVFAADDSARWIDFSIELIAAEGPVTFGDTKEGTFAVRVAGPLNVDEPGDGQIINSRGETNDAAWGRRADWVDYRGQLQDQKVGIAIFTHPTNPRHPCRWHVRGYGLFAANPFGNSEFPDPDPDFQEVTLQKGETMIFTYRVVLHDGRTQSTQLKERYRGFAEKSKFADKTR